MNKKLNTVIFIVAGTILNITLMCFFIFGLLAGATAILRGFGYVPGHNIYIPFLIGSILGGMVLSFFIYSKIMKFVQSKFDIEKYLEPLIKKRHVRR